MWTISWWYLVLTLKSNPTQPFHDQEKHLVEMHAICLLFVPQTKIMPKFRPANLG